MGATDSTDVITYFSNYGSCVDILAPGYDVVSACASLKCGNQNSYVSFSGTSMACPHVSGMVAQILEKLSPKYVSSTGGLQMITIAEVMSELSCQSSKNKITLDKRDTITRNFLLHTPDRMDHDTVNMTALSFGSTYEPDIQQEATCEYTTDCINGCSNNGYCMPGTPYIPSLTHASSLAPTVAPTPQCYCSDTYYGASCGSTTDSLCTQHGSKKITVTMFDTYGDGWTFSSYAITDANGYIVDNGMDSLCGGQEAARQHCLPPGDYTFSINRGYLANEVAWFIQECSVTAGSPYNAILSISGGVCTVKCPVGSLKTTLTLKDAYGEGWNDAYYSIYYEQSGRSIFGGTLVSGETIDHTICLPIGCSSLFLESLGASPDDISMVICGKTIHGRDLATICIDSNLQCTATVLSTKPVTTSSTCPNTELTFYTMDPMLTGWSSNIFNISSEPLNTHITLQNSSSSGFLSSSQICLPDGCYDFAAINTMTSDSKADKTYWFGCEYFGRVPTISQICVEKKYGLCYGLQGCLYTKSYAHTTDLQLGFLTLYDKKSRSDKLISDFNIHGVNNLCALDDGCYKMTVGSGQLYDNISDRGQVQVCGNTLQIPFVVDLCIANNMTTCTATVEKGSNPLCPAGFIPQLLTKLSTSGLGWGAGGKYTINYYDPAIGANPGGVQQPGSGGGGSGGGGDGDGTDDIFGADDQMGGGYGAGYGGGYLDSTNEDRLISSSNSDYQNQQNDSDDTFHSILKQYRRQQRSLMKNTSPDQNKPSSSVEANNHIHRQITQKVKNQSKMHTMAGEVVQTGTLADGQIGFETFCLETNMCYTFTISSKAASSVLFLLCGYIGSGNTNKVAFCVSDNGCQFINSNEPYYDKSVDDDFPISIQQSYPTISPAILSHSNHPVAHSNVVVPPTKNISPTIGSPNSGIDPSDLNSAIQGSSMTLVIVLVLFFIISGTVLITLFAINYKNMRTDMFRYMSGSTAYDRLDNNDEEGRARFEMVNRGLSMDSSVHSNTVGIVGGTHVINPIMMSASRPGRTFEVVEIDDEADVEGGAIGIKGGSSTTISNGVNEGNNINTTSSSSTTNEVSSLLKPT